MCAPFPPELITQQVERRPEEGLDVICPTHVLNRQKTFAHLGVVVGVRWLKPLRAEVGVLKRIRQDEERRHVDGLVAEPKAELDHVLVERRLFDHLVLGERLGFSVDDER